MIYDKRVLPPFIGDKRVGVFPIEAVVATIEVKSYLGKRDLLMAEKAARRLRQVVADLPGRYTVTNTSSPNLQCAPSSVSLGQVQQHSGRREVERTGLQPTLVIFGPSVSLGLTRGLPSDRRSGACNRPMSMARRQSDTSQSYLTMQERKVNGTTVYSARSIGIGLVRTRATILQ